jgi:aminoglycoside phosphotransferase family enzyme
MREQTLTGGLLEDLARPEAYPAPRPTRVKVVTTPLSWVFITDHDVWKVKRPVDYGFVDYTSLWLRRHFCYEEVRLNQRLAPDVYRGVVPVYFDGERHAFGTSGRIVDYAVQMRRLPDSASADRLLERGELTRDDLSRLAQRLCALYSTARTGSVWDSVDVIRANVNGNFAQASAYIGRFVDPETFDTVKAWQLERLTRDAPSFAMRHTQDRIREGHGDLRLEHVYFEDNEPIVIDAIEFNERFRMADVAADVAFLAMDLDARSRPDLAADFLATIARESDDYGLYTVVDFYLSYRAWVRGKVAAFVASDPSTAPEEAERKGREATRLFALARTYAEAGRPWASSRSADRERLGS